VAGQEQEAITLRYVNSDLCVKEQFLGFYSLSSTKAVEIFEMIKDCLARFELNLQDIRAQAYDGAANMSGQHGGVQALIMKKNPLAVSFHCLSHITNLVMEHCTKDMPLIRDTMAAINELGCLHSKSRKLREIFSDRCNPEEGNFEYVLMNYF